jgi:hypothetical protein
MLQGDWTMKVHSLGFELLMSDELAIGSTITRAMSIVQSTEFDVMIPVVLQSLPMTYSLPRSWSRD